MINNNNYTNNSFFRSSLGLFGGGGHNSAVISDLRIRDNYVLVNLVRNIIEDTTKQKEQKQLEIEVIARNVLNYANLNIYSPYNWYRSAEIVDARAIYFCIKTMAQLVGVYLPSF